jgi:hypothetical protein
MDDRERGFIVIQRQILSSALWQSLRGDQRGVMISILLLANWTSSRARWKGEWFEVGRGELAHTIQTIAKHSNASVAVVRSTLAALMADDTRLGGNGPFLTQRYPVPSTGPSTGPRVLRVVNYDKYQSVAWEPRTAASADLAQDPAQASHRPHTDLAQREPREPLEPVETPSAPSPSVSTHSPVVVVIPCNGVGRREYGVTDAQLDKWRPAFPGLDVTAEVRKAAAWCDANPTKRKTYQGVPRFLVAWLTRAQDRGGSPQNLVTKPARGMAAPSTDWASEAATKF